jgi:hypothetical protein
LNNDLNSNYKLRHLSACSQTPLKVAGSWSLNWSLNRAVAHSRLLKILYFLQFLLMNDIMKICVTNVLRKPKIQCLFDTKVDPPANRDDFQPPGELMDLNQQCRDVLGPTSGACEVTRIRSSSITYQRPIFVIFKAYDIFVSYLWDSSLHNASPETKTEL